MVNRLPFLDKALQVRDADGIYAESLRSVLEGGVEVQAGASPSVGSQKKSLELLNFSVRIDEPRQRVVFNPSRRINLPAAVARFLWMMAGSDRLYDIAFYEPKVSFFSDDGLTVPGSNYGQRMLQPRPGLDQLTAVVDRLRADPGTRRAAIAIYHPEDAVRSSKDIPCTFGLFYHVRREQLFATTLMRSNNAVILLPYNIFEFSLLAEVVAAELTLPQGPLTHAALSMHIYESDYTKAREIVEAFDAGVVPSTIPAIDPDPSPLTQIRELAKLEAELRHKSAGISSSNVEEWIERGRDQLNPYWVQYLFLLLLHVARTNRDQFALDSLRTVLSEPWSHYLPHSFWEIEGEVVQGRQRALQLESPRDVPQTTVLPFRASRLRRSLVEKAQKAEQGGTRLSWQDFATLEGLVGDQLAARGQDFELSDADFRDLLGKLDKDPTDG